MVDGKEPAPKGMRSFWDAKGRENAMFYVSSYRAYGDQDPAEFWKWGHILADRYLGESGLVFTGDEVALDLGCGIGRFTAPFAERFRHVHAVDVAPSMIEQARGHLAGRDNVTFHLGSGADLAMLEDGSIDFAWSYIMFQHIPDPAVTLNYLRELGRVLRPGGHALFQVDNAPPPGLRARLRLGSRLRGLLRRLRGEAPAPGPTGLDDPAWVGSRIDLATLRRTCAEAGLVIESLRGEGTQYTWVCARRA